MDRAWLGSRCCRRHSCEHGAASLAVHVAAVGAREPPGVPKGVLAQQVTVRAVLGRHPSHRRLQRLLVPSALAGAALVSAADILVRLIPGENELRLGVVTAFIGAPFFLVYLFKQRRVW